MSGEFGSCFPMWTVYEFRRMNLFVFMEQTCSYICSFKAIHMETDPQTISAYLIYLSQHAPVEEQASHNDLALVRRTKILYRVFLLCISFDVALVFLQDVARLIVERSTIMNSLFSKHSCRPESDAVLSAFLTIFSTYIRRMRKTKEGEDLYSWVSLGRKITV